LINLISGYEEYSELFKFCREILMMWLNVLLERVFPAGVNPMEFTYVLKNRGPGLGNLADLRPFVPQRKYI
jgi:hypothetical protein